MKITLTGVNGFLGNYVLSELLDRNIEVIPFTRKNVVKKKNVEFVKFDLYKDKIKSNKKNFFSENIIHLAWGGLPNYKSEEHLLHELPFQYQFLESLIKSGIKNLTIAGTCLEYGMISGCLDESMIANPNNQYAIAKYALYKKITDLKRHYPFNLQWCRIFYLYGQGQHKNSLWSQLQHDAKLKKLFFNMSGGDQIRDYIHVREAAKKLVDLHLTMQDIGIINVCSGIPITVKKLVNFWIVNNNWNITPKYNVFNYPDYEPMSFWGSSEKLEQILN